MAIRECDFGLLLVSPAFLISPFIKENELPHFVSAELYRPESRRLAAPVMLKPILLDGRMNLRGLQHQQFFTGKKSRAFSELKGRSAQEAFALDLASKIDMMLKAKLLNPSPSQQSSLPTAEVTESEKRGAVSEFNTDRSTESKVIVILTAIKVEAQAVERRLRNVQRVEVHGTTCRQGEFEASIVVVVEVGAGNPSAAAIGTRMLDHFKPEIAAFIGVAGGIKDVRLGDVVVATKVYGYESGKDSAGGFRPRADIRTSSHWLESRARDLARVTHWQGSLAGDPSVQGEPRIFVGPIAAGEVVVANDRGRIARFLRKQYSDALAVEMEGRGFLEAVHITDRCSGVVVRGISDLLIGKAEADATNSQARAADAAAAAFFAMIDLEPGPVVRPVPPDLRPLAPPAEDRANDKDDDIRREEWMRCHRETLTAVLKSSVTLMDALDKRAPSSVANDVRPQTTDGDRPRRLFESLMHVRPFTAVVGWLNETYNDLRGDEVGRKALTKACGYLLPFLYVSDKREKFDRLHAGSLGNILELPIAFSCFAEMVVSGIGALPAIFNATEKLPATAKGERDLANVPFSGLELDLDSAFRTELFRRLTISDAGSDLRPEQKDKLINIALDQAFMSDKVRYYFTFYTKALPHPPASLREISRRYKALAVIALDEALKFDDELLWIELRQLFGHRP